MLLEMAEPIGYRFPCLCRKAILLPSTDAQGCVWVANLAGRSTRILPGERHILQLFVSGCGQVRKGVNKIPAAFVGL